MKRFSLSFIAVGAIILLITSMVAAQPRGGMMLREDKRLGKPWIEELGLTDQQKEQIRQVMLDTRKKNIDVEAKLKLARIELHELMDADTPDQGKINAKISELSQLREKIMRSHIESRLAIQKVLTAEQRQKAKELRPFGPFGRGFGHFDGGPGMMRRGGFGRGPGLHIAPEQPEPDEEF